MQVLIIGGAGMIGRRLAARLLADGSLAGKRLNGLTLFDTVEPEAPRGADIPVRCRQGDLSEAGVAERLLASRPEVIFHLAAVVSGEAETDFDKGYRVNLDATRGLFESIRASGLTPRVVFTSSIAVFGAPFPDPIPDDFHTTPLTSYGTQKAMGELLLADYSRREIFDGIGLRLPTIVVRPGKPNKAASSFFSGIIREPVAGLEAVCPVSPNLRHWMASPDAAVDFLVHAAGIDSARLRGRPNLTMPGLSITVGAMLAALGRVAGAEALQRVKMERDPFIEKIVSGWPSNFTAARARDLGFQADRNFDDIVRAHMAEVA